LGLQLGAAVVALAVTGVMAFGGLRGSDTVEAIQQPKPVVTAIAPIKNAAAPFAPKIQAPLPPPQPLTKTQVMQEFVKAHPVSDTSPTNIKAFIHWAAEQYGTNGDVLDRMADLESHYNVSSVNNWDSNAMNGTPSGGLMQYVPSTFTNFSNKAKQENPEVWATVIAVNEPNTANGQAELDPMNWQYQALTTAWALKHGYGPWDWPNTWAKMGNPQL
jgi:hypothetical protein